MHAKRKKKKRKKERKGKDKNSKQKEQSALVDPFQALAGKSNTDTHRQRCLKHTSPSARRVNSTITRSSAISLFLSLMGESKIERKMSDHYGRLTGVIANYQQQRERSRERSRERGREREREVERSRERSRERERRARTHTHTCTHAHLQIL